MLVKCWGLESKSCLIFARFCGSSSFGFKLSFIGMLGIICCWSFSAQISHWNWDLASLLMEMFGANFFLCFGADGAMCWWFLGARSFGLVLSVMLFGVWLLVENVVLGLFWASLILSFLACCLFGIWWLFGVWRWRLLGYGLGL